jgi:hypothetical protein
MLAAHQVARAAARYVSLRGAFHRALALKPLLMFIYQKLGCWLRFERMST